MKGNIIILLICILVTGSVTAAEFDNIKTYNEELKVVTITNAFGLGDVIGQAKLNTPLNVRVGAGYQKVAEFNIWAYQDYNDAIKQFTFTDMKKKTKVNREFDLKMLTYKEVEVEDNYDICTYDGPEMNCERFKNGTHIELKEVWTKVTPADLKKNDFVTIGIFTEVQIGDHVDWIPTIYGIEIEEWAEWTEDLNTGLYNYFKMEGTSGPVIDSINNENGTISGTVTRDQEGIILKASNVTTTGTNYISIPTTSINKFAMNYWVRNSGAVDDWGGGFNPDLSGTWKIFSRRWSNTDHWGAQVSGGGNCEGSATVIDDDWHMITMTFNGSMIVQYIDGVYDCSFAHSTDIVIDSYDIFRSESSATRQWYGGMDEVGWWVNESLTPAQVTQLYNGGAAITWTDSFGTAPEVTLITPINNSNQTTSLISFVANVTDDLLVENVTLYIDGVSNQTNSSHINGTYTFSTTLGFGSHNWSIIAVDNESQSTNSDTRFFTVNATLPTVTLTSPGNNTQTSNPNVDFTFTATDTFGITNASLYLDGVINQTNSSGINGTYTFSKVLSIAEHNWSVTAFSIYGNSTASGTRFINITSGAPVITSLTSPVDVANLTNTSVTFTTGLIYDAINLANVSLLIDGVINQTNSSGLNASIYSWDVTSIPEGTHNWTVKATDNESNSATTVVRTFRIDITAPIINITSPPTTFGLLVAGESIDLNWTLTEDNPGTCWYQYTLTEPVTNSTGYSSFVNITDSEILIFGAGAKDFGSASTFPAGRRFISNETGTATATWTTPRLTGRCDFDSEVYSQQEFFFDEQNGNYTCMRTVRGDYTMQIGQGGNDAKITTFRGAGDNKTVNCSLNTTTFDYISGLNDITFFANDIFGNIANETRSWTISYEEINRTHNTQSYTTKEETFSINVSGATSLKLFYNGTEYSTTKSGDLYSRTIQIPVDNVGNNSIYWRIDDTTNTDITYQFVNDTVFTLCNATFQTPFLNITFKDESDSSTINASIPTSTFEYWLGDGSVTKTYTLINNTDNFFYEFCATPNETINLNAYIQYKQGAIYPQRIYDQEDIELTNETTNLTLYLLSVSDGLFVTFQVFGGQSTALEGVDVTGTRVVSGVSSVVAQGTTDAAGTVTFWLDPNFLHTLTFVKSGFVTVIETITPTQTLYTITMESGAAADVIDNAEGVIVVTKPSGSFLDDLTIYEFIYTINSTILDLDEYGFELFFPNGSSIHSNSDTTSTGGTLTHSINTTNISRIVMDYYYITNSTRTNGTTYWLIYATNDFSIYHFFEKTSTYISANAFGILGDDSGYFAKAIISILILVLVSGSISIRYGLGSEQAVTGILFGLVFMLNMFNFIPNPDFLTIINLGDFLVFLIAILVITSIIKEETR